MIENPSHAYWSDATPEQEFLKSKYLQNAGKSKADRDRNQEDVKQKEVSVNQHRNRLEDLKRLGFAPGDPEYDQEEQMIRSLEAGLHYLVNILAPALERRYQVDLALAADCENRIRKNKFRAGLPVPATTMPTADPDAAIISRTM